MNDQTKAAAAAAPSNPTRRRALLAIGAVTLAAAAGYGAYWALVLNHFESTDNAYVAGHAVQITPQVGGTVLAIEADDTDLVKRGQTLVRLDPADGQVALDQAEAQLAQTVREVRTLYANNSTLKAQIALREAEQARAESELAKAQDDVNRRRPLVASGAVGKEEFDHASMQLAAGKSAVAAAASAVTAAREQLASNQSLTDGVAVADHPSVQRAAARVREAHLALSRSDLSAPVGGVVARRNVQVGQRVAAGTPLMTLISLDELWVDANLKESQLRRVRLGQPVTLVADVYGNKVEYHGKVAGLGAGTGAAFALLPAQNATGNWIKVVQRVPVRIELDPAELAKHPLRVGLSMEATVDVGDQSGPLLADKAAAPALAKTGAQDAQDAEADALVRRIIGRQLGSRAAPAAKS